MGPKQENTNVMLKQIYKSANFVAQLIPLGDLFVKTKEERDRQPLVSNWRLKIETDDPE